MATLVFQGYPGQGKSARQELLLRQLEFDRLLEALIRAEQDDIVLTRPPP